MSYGPNINIETAKKIAAPAMAEARKNNWNMAIAIVDTAGDLVYFEKMDDTQIGSTGVAISKARSAARFKRPTKAFQDALAAGGEGLRILALDGAIPVEGGIPLVARRQDRRRHRRVGRHQPAGRRRGAGSGQCTEVGAGAIPPCEI